MTPRRVAWTLLLLLALQLHAVQSLHAGGRVCDDRPLPVVPGLAVTLRLDTASLHPGGTGTATAVLANPGSRTIDVRDPAAVLVAAGAHDPVSWGSSDGRSVRLPPRSAARLQLTLHTSRCSDGSGALAPGFYDLALRVRADGRWGLVGQQAVMLSP